MKILIVDDEALARERLRGLVQELYPEKKIIEASNGLEAFEMIKLHGPDLVLLDIRMPRMDGLEVANHVLHLDNPPSIIFTTAYQEHALDAFDANAVDYLLKPIRKQRLKTALERAATPGRQKLRAVADANQSSSKRTHLNAMMQGDIKLIAIENIYYLKAEQKYVTAAWPGGEMLVDEPLVSLAEEFSDNFIQIHRNALVGIKYIDGLLKTNNRQHVIKVKDIPVQLVVSRRHLPDVRKLIKQR